MNGRLGKDRFNSLRILLDSGARLSVVTTWKNFKKITKPVCWSTQGGKFKIFIPGK